jgi:hypothetical protein
VSFFASWAATVPAANANVAQTANIRIFIGTLLNQWSPETGD